MRTISWRDVYKSVRKPPAPPVKHWEDKRHKPPKHKGQEVNNVNNN